MSILRAARHGRVLTVLTVIVLISMVVVTIAAASALTQVRRDGDLAALIQTQLEQERTVDFLFAQPITGTVRTVSSSDAQVTVGADYVCFGTPWNNGSREYCVPFANVVSVTFVEP